MQRPGLIGERAIGLFLVAFLALNPPILSIFSAEGFFVGVPLLYFYLFGAWSVIILLIGVHGLAAKARRQSLAERDRAPGG